jgi:cystathionine beta-lyase/cystathionine gamma-synthase
MCYQSLLNGDATERSLPTLLRGERWFALRSGIAAAAVTVLALFSEGFGLDVTVALGVGALVLGFLLHQAVLIGGACALRLWERRVGTRGVERDPARP